MNCLPPPVPNAPRRAESRWDSGAIIRLLLLCAVLGSAWAARSVFNPLQDLAKADLSLDDVQLGLVQGAAMSIPSALLSIWLGRTIDTRNRITILIMLALLTMLGSIATAYAASFGTLIAARGFAGLGMLQEAVIFSLVADMFPPERRGRANIMIVVGEYAGSALGFALAGWLLPGIGDWRGIQLVFGIAGLLLALPLLWLCEPVRHECGPPAARARLREGWRVLLGMGAFLWPMLIAQVAMIAANNAASIWAVSVFIRDFGLSAAEGGGLVATATFVPPLLGATIAGVAIDRLRIGRGGAILVAAVAATAAIPAALFPLAGSPALAAALLSLLMMAHAAAGLGSATLGVLAIPNELRGLWFGICGVPTALVSFATAPVLIGWLGADIGGPHALARSLTLILLVAGLIALGGFAGAWRAWRSALAHQIFRDRMIGG